MSTIGGEIGQLRSLRTSFDREAQAVHELTTRIRAELSNTWWKGPAAERFRGAWNDQFEPSLRKLQIALQDASTEVNRRTEALLQAGS